MSAAIGKTVSQHRLALIHTDPEASAQIGELQYVHGDEPGITRTRRGKKFTYHWPDHQPVTDTETLERIRLLALPPAYENVWICTRPTGHLQATGRAANGKKQYFYHKHWRSVRNLTKFSQMISFGENLSVIRSQVDTDLKLPGLPRRKVLAAVVRLLECTLIRVGNEQYAQQHDSYGLTTLTTEHVDIHGNKIRFEFRGKSGKEWSLTVQDARLAKIIKKCHNLPGYELFQYLDLEGQPQHVGSKDVNDYLKEISGEYITAKCFRTWAGTVEAYRLLKACENAGDCSETANRHTVAKIIKQVAEQLGNTASVCRKNYIHPHVLDCYLDGSIHTAPACPSRESLSADELAVLHLLKSRFQTLARESLQ